MSANSNLVKKTITDKNGVTTSRWVKPSNDVSASAAIPPPYSPPDSELINLRGYLYKLVSRCDPNDVDLNAITKAVRGFSLDTIRVIVEDVKDNPDERMEIGALWIGMYGTTNESYLRELFAYRGAFDPSTDYSFVEDAVYYMRNYEALPQMDDYSKADEELKQQLYDVLAITETMLGQEYEDNPRGVEPKMSESMFRLVVERPDDLERISEVIHKHPGVRDGEQIAMILDSETPSLNDGIL